MDGLQGVQIHPLRREYLDEVIRIHRAGLPYSLSTRLGDEHLAYLYQAMSRDHESFVGVAIKDGRPVGAVSGTADANALKTRILRSMPAARVAAIAAGLLRHPSLFIVLLQEAMIAAPVSCDGNEIRAVLSTIAVDPSFQSLGVGRRLVAAIEEFFGLRNVACYRLETLVGNGRARAFYKSLGFEEHCMRAGSIVIIKRIGP